MHFTLSEQTLLLDHAVSCDLIIFSNQKFQAKKNRSISDFKFLICGSISHTLTIFSSKSNLKPFLKTYLTIGLSASNEKLQWQVLEALWPKAVEHADQTGDTALLGLSETLAKMYKAKGVDPDKKLQIFPRENIFNGHRDAIRKVVELIEKK